MSSQLPLVLMLYSLLDRMRWGIPLSRNCENFSMAGGGENSRDCLHCAGLGCPGREGSKIRVDFVSKSR